MFGDFFKTFGIDQFMQSMRQAQQAQQPQVPFAPGQVDVQGGIFGQLGEAQAGSLHEIGLGAGGAASGRGGGAPTAAAVAQAPGLPGGGAGSPLQAGGASPMAPGARPQQLPQTKLEQGADDFMRAGDTSLPGMGGQRQQLQRRFEDLMR